jgi:hypothetical protein
MCKMTDSSTSSGASPGSSPDAAPTQTGSALGPLLDSGSGATDGPLADPSAEGPVAATPPIRSWVDVGADVLLGLLTTAVAAALTAFLFQRAILYAHALTTAPYDGAFQLFDPLRRYALGQLPGRDFVVFHGIGTTLAHYPIFKLLGGDVHASLLAGNALAYLAFVLPTVFFLRVMRWPWLAALALPTVLIYTARYWKIEALTDISGSQIAPRMAMPLFTAGWLMLSERRRRTAALSDAELSAGRYLRLGLADATMLALCFLGSTEQGLSVSLATIYALTLTGATFYPERPGLRGWLVNSFERGARAVVTVLAAWMILAVFYMILCGEGWAAMLRYSFKTVPGEQVALFGVPPGRLLLSLEDVLTYTRFVDRVTFSALVVLPLLHILAGWKFLREERGAVTGAIFYTLYGIGSTFGVLVYARVHLLLPITRSQILIVATFVPFMVYHALRALNRPLPRLQLWTVRTGSAVLAGFALWMSVPVVVDAHQRVQKLSRPTWGTLSFGRSWKKEFDQIRPELDPTIKAYRDKKLAEGRVPLWSTYAGLFEAFYDVLHPSTDYIIHAIGPEMHGQYIEAFRKTRPERLLTQAAGRWPFGAWLTYSWWDWSEEMFLNYQPRKVIERYVIWEPIRDLNDPANWVEPGPWSGDIALDPSSPIVTFQVPPGDERVISVEMDYEAHNPWKRVPMFGGLLRLLVESSRPRLPTPISTPPHRTRHAFPMLVPATGNVRFTVSTATPTPGATVTLKALRWREVPMAEGAWYQMTKGRLKASAIARGEDAPSGPERDGRDRHDRPDRADPGERGDRGERDDSADLQ